LYKHKIILFGGFYDTLREVRLLVLLTYSIVQNCVNYVYVIFFLIETNKRTWQQMKSLLIVELKCSGFEK